MGDLTIKINGVEESTKNLGKLGDNLDKVDVKVNNLSLSAKDVADVCKKESQEVMEYIVL